MRKRRWGRGGRNEETAVWLLHLVALNYDYMVAVEKKEKKKLKVKEKRRGDVV